MPRVKRGVTAHARHKKVLKLTKGHRATKHTLYRLAGIAVDRKILAELAYANAGDFAQLADAAKGALATA
jgi:ribosomal protein L20